MHINLNSRLVNQQNADMLHDEIQTRATAKTKGDDVKKLGMAALAALTLAGSMVALTGTAEARGGWRGGGWHGGGYYRGYGGYGVGLGVATGLALGGAYGYYGNPYYGGDCWVRNRVYFDQWGRRFVRPVRVCG
jgi:hypothetical protein